VAVTVVFNGTGAGDAGAGGVAVDGAGAGGAAATGAGAGCAAAGAAAEAKIRSAKAAAVLHKPGRKSRRRPKSRMVRPHVMNDSITQLAERRPTRLCGRCVVIRRRPNYKVRWLCLMSA
jgi:hypothetical protein